MAQTGYTPISLYYSATASSVPVNTNLAAGELAINTNDGKLYYKDSSGVVQLLASKAGSSGTFGAISATSITNSGLTSGRVVYSTTGGLETGSANLTFDGTNLGLAGGTANSVAYLNGSKVLTTGSALTFDGNTFVVASGGASFQGTTAPSAGAGVEITYGAIASAGRILSYDRTGATRMPLIVDGSYFAGYTGGSERVRIDTSGNVWIGTASPSNSKLDIASGNINLSDTYILAWGGGTARPNIEGSKASNYLRFSTGAGATHMAIDSSGNVGIGTTSPAAKLDVRGSSTFLVNATNPTAWISVDSALTTGSVYNQWNTTSSIGITGTYTNHPYTLVTNNTERMRIDTSGNVLVNTTTGYGKFTVQNSAGTGKVLLDNYATVPTTENVMSIYADATNGYIQSYNNGYKNIAICSGGGNALVGTTTQKNTTFGGASSGITVANTGAPSVVVWDKTDTTYVTWLGQAGASGYLGNNANGPLVISTNGTERMRIDASGNVGIGTSSPSSKLHVASAAATSCVIAMTGSTTASSYIQINNTGGNFYLGLDSSTGGSFGGPAYSGNLFMSGAYPMLFWTNSSERMRIDSSGNVGIGTTSPSSGGKLAVTGNGAFTGSNGPTGNTQGVRILTSNTSGDGVTIDSFCYGSNGYGPLYLNTGNAGTPVMTLTVAGNVGIGTSSPATKLAVAGSLGVTGQANFVTSAGSPNMTIGNTANGDTGFIMSWLSTGSASVKNWQWTFNNYSNGMSLLSSTTSGSSAFVLADTLWNVKDAGQQTITDKPSANTSAFKFLSFVSNSAEAGSITRVAQTAVVTYNTTSDYRLKKNQAPLTGSGEFIDALKPKTWEWVSGGKATGFIAHEFAEVSPLSVTGEKDATQEEEYINSSGVKATRTVPLYQGMQASSSEVIANLVAEIQSLRKRLADAGI